MEQAHVKTSEEVLAHFSTDSEKGLTEDQVRRYQEKYGLNGMCWLFHVCFIFSTKPIVFYFFRITGRRRYGFAFQNAKQNN